MLPNIKLLRKEKGMSQEALGDIVSLSQQTINGYENTDVEPDIKTLIKMAEFFETTVDFLVGNSDVRHKFGVINYGDLENHEMKHIEMYRKLPESSRKAIDVLIEGSL